jgi:hypothetical protein
MHKRTRAALDDLLGGFAARDARQRQAEHTQEAQPAAFRRSWDQKVARLVQPVFEEFAEALRDKGHGVEVEVAREAGSPASVRDATLRLVPASFVGQALRPDRRPCFSLRVDEDRRKVWLFKSTVLGARGGTEGPNGEFDVSAITREWLEERLLAFAREVLAR